MQQGHGRGPSKGGGRGSESGGGQKAQDVAHVIEGECGTKPSLDQPSRENSFARIAKALEYRRPKASVAHEVGNDGGSDHANHDSRTRAPAQHDKNADSNT